MARPTRKARKAGKKGSVLSVRSPAAVKSFEKILRQGPLTLVYINAKWCGACHKFTDEVWNPLTQVKNKSMNLASVDSEMIGKTSLANVPRKFFPTLLLVGKDGKAATFKDENGEPTNAMPRNNTLSEDKDKFTELIQTPVANKHVDMANTPVANTPMATPMANTPMANTPMMNTPATLPTVNRSKSSSLVNQMNNAANESKERMTLSNIMKTSPKRTVSNLPIKRTNSPPRETNLSALGKSPFEGEDENDNPSIMRERTIPSSSLNVPDVGADLVKSQSRNKSVTQMPGELMKGGRMLRAIRNKTASLKAMLKMRKRSTRRRRH